MFLGVFFILSGILFGVAVSKLLKIKLTLKERICLSTLFGISASTITVYFFSYMQKSLNLAGVAAVAVLLLLPSLLIIGKGKTFRNTFSVTHLWKSFSFENFAVAIAGFAASLILNLRCVLREEFNSLYSSLYVHGDYSFHVSIITSFLYRNNFPPQYPIMVNAPMAYPILVDFLSAILIKTGFDLRSSIIIPNVIFQTLTLCLISSMATRIFKKRLVGAFSAILFFFFGNMGVIYAFQDLLRQGDFVGWITCLPTDYSGSGISDLPEVRFGNPVAVMLMPQRASALGIGISILVYILVFHSIRSRENLRELIFTGVLIGLLPMIHSHSFIAVAVVVFFLIIVFKKSLSFLVLVFVPAMFLALPQILLIQACMEGGFMGSTIGWLGMNAERIMALNWSTPLNVLSSSIQSALLLTWFWLMNIGAIILPFIFGFKKADGAARSLYFPFLTLFILGNFIRFQPWDWDNYKIFLHWLIATVIFASFGVIRIGELAFKDLKSSATCGKPHKRLLKPLLGVATLAAILFFSTASGFLSCAKMVQESCLMWSEADLTFADWVRKNTPPESVFLTSTDYLHPVPTVGGRQIVLGYEGWLWSHGIGLNRIYEVKNDVIEMFKGNYNLIRKYDVNFISITPYERTFAAYSGFTINLEFFNRSEYFEKVYDEILDGQEYIIFEVLS
ncbi:MAG: hypothetical protein QW717_03300 [Candidatus Bathyarchaeia archaeon]